MGAYLIEGGYRVEGVSSTARTLPPGSKLAKRRPKLNGPPFWKARVYYRVGERGRNRTFNLLIKSQLLCQLSYAPGDNSCDKRRCYGWKRLLAKNARSFSDEQQRTFPCGRLRF
jgi:hypothetical protein